MGNSPSAVEGNRRVPHKLSKPRTGKPTTAGLLSTDGLARHSSFRYSSPGLAGPPLSYPFSPVPSSTDDPASFPVIEGSHQPIPEPVSRRSSIISQKRLSLFRSKSSQGPQDRPEHHPSRRNSSIGLPKRSRTIDPVSRSNSMAFDLGLGSYYGSAMSDSWQPGSRTSWNYDLSSYEAQRLLNLVEEPMQYEQTTTVVTENQFTVVSEVTWKSSHPAGSESAPLSRANSDLSLYMPVRRRSVIQTPGVATRTRSTTGTSRAAFRHSHPPTPSLSRQQSRESMGSRGVSMPPPPRLEDPDLVPRVVTPCEGDYQTIGAFKLGSLRITNGTASPVGTPEPGSKSHFEEQIAISERRLDYFSATKRLGDSGEGVDVFESTNMSATAQLSRIGTPKHVGLHLKPIVTAFTPSDGDKQPIIQIKDLASPNSEPEVAHLPEVLVNAPPLDASAAASPKLQTTSKHTAVEDHLFEEDAQPEYSTSEVLDIRLDPNAKSQPVGKADQAPQEVASVTRSDSGFVSSPTSEYSSKKPLSKADSGYSSNVSLRSFQQKPPVPEKDYPDFKPALQPTSPLSPDRASFQLAELPLPSPTITPPEEVSPEVVPSHPSREAPPPPLPPKDEVSAAVQPPVSGTPAPKERVSMDRARSLLSTSNILRKKQSPSPIDSASSRTNGPVSPASTPRTPLSAKSDTSGASMRISPQTQKQGKLQRLLSLNRSRGPLAVHTTHVQEKADIPSVPQAVEAKLNEHSGLFPMTTKRLALKKQLSKDTLMTIFSVGSFDLNPGDAPSKKKSSEETQEEAVAEAATGNRRHTFQGVPASLAHVAAAVMPVRKPIPCKPVPVRAGHLNNQNVNDSQPDSVGEKEAELATYHSVNNSLGNNAYDAAFMAMTEARSAESTIRKPGRTMSMTAQMERRWDSARLSLQTSTNGFLSPPALPSPLRPDMFPPKNSRTPPPITMMTQKRPASLRVPPPLRPQSTPPTSLTRKKSRESYPPGSFDRQGMISPPNIPPMNPRRSMTLRDPSPNGSTQRGVPDWLAEADRSTSRRSSIDHSRSSSLSSRSQGQSSSGSRPIVDSRYLSRPQGQTLKHRASYDGYSALQGRGGMYPSPADRASPKPMMDAYGDGGGRQYGQPPPVHHSQQQQWDQYGRYPPYVPRGHYRNRSMGNRQGQYAQAPPFRILHSYNSPAYRNVPIWG